MGTVFSIMTAGTHMVLYSFKGGGDGSVPTAGVIEIGNTLYGTPPKRNDRSVRYDSRRRRI